VNCHVEVLHSKNEHQTMGMAVTIVRGIVKTIANSTKLFASLAFRKEMNVAAKQAAIATYAVQNTSIPNGCSLSP